MNQKAENVPLGAAFIFLAAVAFACMGALVKFGSDIPDQQLVFFRNVLCLLAISSWVLFSKPKPLKTKMLVTHLVRAGAGLLNMYCFFFSIRYILLTDAMLLNNTMPLFVPLVVWIWKGEKPPLKIIPGLIVGFIGVVLILRPGVELFQPAALVALASGIFMSISMAGIRELGLVEPMYRILFYYFAITSFISAIPLFWALDMPTPLEWIILFAVAIFAGLCQFFLTKGYQYASAPKISPFIYFAVVVSGFFDWVFWNHPPDWVSYLGTLAVVMGAIWCIRTEIRG